jgi:hypothetical protein
MKIGQGFPEFDEQFPALNHFILELVQLYNAGKITTWEDLAQQVNTYFSPTRMEQMESVIPGWCKMASFAGGLTLTHVMCVFLGLYMMPEFLSMPPHQKGLMQWVILLHDLEKEVREKRRDHMHAIRSAVTAARLLPDLSFDKTHEYPALIEGWSELTLSSHTRLRVQEEVQDNSKIPQILTGIERIFGHNTPAALVLKTILFHLSVDMKEWPPMTPLTNEEMLQYFDMDLLPLLKVMHLGDTDGWSLFEPAVNERLRKDTIAVFDELGQLLISSASRRHNG